METEKKITDVKEIKSTTEEMEVDEEKVTEKPPVKKKNAFKLHMTFLLIVIVYFVMGQVKSHGVDSDYYFIVNTGKWIMQNHKVPTENYWTIHENFKIVIQQWVLCVIQYNWYKLFGSMSSLVILAAVFSAVFNISLYRYIKQFTSRVDTAIVAMILSNLAASAYLSARPNIITASTLLVELTVLHRFFVKRDISTKRFFLEIAILSIWQINFQSAGWYFLLVMIMPYIVPPIWRKGWYKKENQPEFSYRIRLRYGVPALWLIIFTGFLNPNGLEGMKYLSSSADLISTGKVISEMNSASLTNPIGLMVLLEVLLFGIAASQKKLSSEQTWLTLGTCLLAIDAYRNAYMIVFGISILVIVLMGEDDAVIKNKCETSQRNYLIIKIMYIIASVAILAVMISNFITEDTEGQIDMMDSALSEQVQYLEENEADRDKEDLVLYTVFETGQYFQFNGYKTYIDARPECYMKTINGQEDIWSEFYDIVNGLASTDEEIQAFLDKYNFDYLCTGRVGHIGAYLRASDDYEEVVYGANYSLFKNISKSTDTTVTEQTEEKSLEESETEVTTEIESETAASN